MRNYILTDRERTLIEAFMETQDVPQEDYGSYCQLRHQFRKNSEVLTMDLALLETFMETTRKPKCFGTEEVKYIHGYKGAPRKERCIKCDAQGPCLKKYYQNQRVLP